MYLIGIFTKQENVAFSKLPLKAQQEVGNLPPWLGNMVLVPVLPRPIL